MAKFRVERPGDGPGTVTLMREVREHPDSADKEAYVTSNWVCEEAGELSEISEAGYREWLSKSLLSFDGDLLLPQFGLMESRSATALLAMIPAELEKVGAAIQAAGPLLKRKTAKTARANPGTAGVVRAEAWLSRRVDEIYRQLTREPVDDRMEEWGEGGQALLQRQPDGSFDLLTSMRRGAAACGYGTPLKSLSDGARDICALSLLFALPGFMNGMQDSLPPFMVLDEPDSRLDKRHASALRDFLQGPDGPKQCIWMSLNNHSAFPEDSVLEEEEAQHSPR
ncbi:SAMS2 [Symbiodinium natans]|uniref:SAMS2 protein n=1 Tax=Symbiodinium natans TaxID=878477 RepID=A0A812N2Q0_9DINO|nr:SAMS2 [Symbiodinium natans]